MRLRLGENAGPRRLRSLPQHQRHRPWRDLNPTHSGDTPFSQAMAVVLLFFFVLINIIDIYIILSKMHPFVQYNEL